MLAMKEYQLMKQNDTSVMQMTSEAYKKEVKENREYIKTLADVLLLTAKQDIAQRGHREQKVDDESVNRGNFLEIMELIAKHNPRFAQKLVQIPQNAKYTSPLLQNEIINILAEMVRDEITDEVKEAGEFSVMADETKDVSKKEQISLVLRYYNEGSIKERFLLFKAADKLDASSLANTITECLEAMDVNYTTNLVGQGYDGAAVMSGKKKGVAQLIKQEAKYANYIHCHAHRLNLVLVDTVKNVKAAGEFFSMLERLYVYLSGSHVHKKFVDVQKEMFPDTPPRELQRLSDTRWACRYYSCRNMRDRLQAILQVLEDISEERHADRAVDARGLLGQLNFPFVVLLSIFCTLLKESKGLSDMLQNPQVDLSKATDIVVEFQSTLQEWRAEGDKYEAIWQSASELATTCNIPVIDVQQQRRTRRLPQRLRGFITEHVSAEQQNPTSKDSIRTQVFYPVLDAMLSEMNHRFSKDSCGVMMGVQSLNPEGEHFLDANSVKEFGKLFDADQEDLQHEIPQAKRLLQRKYQGEAYPKTLVKFTALLEPYKDVFSQLFRLCKIAAAIPVSSAGCERSFSALKLIKSYLRNTMSDTRLSDLGILHIERELTDAIDLEEFLVTFAEQHKNLRIKLF